MLSELSQNFLTITSFSFAATGVGVRILPTFLSLSDAHRYLLVQQALVPENLTYLLIIFIKPIPLFFMDPKPHLQHCRLQV